jgi:hypothetical protein
MVENPLAFDFSKTRRICDAFDEAWAFLQGFGSDLTDASKSFATRTILAKRIIEMADQGLMDVTELRDDALAFLQHNPPFRLIAKGSAENYRSPGGLARRARGKAVETVWPHVAAPSLPRGLAPQLRPTLRAQTSLWSCVSWVSSLAEPCPALTYVNHFTSAAC